MTRPSQGELVASYLADLKADFEDATGEYREKLEREIASLESGARIVLDRYGIPTTDPAVIRAVEIDALRLIYACLTAEPREREDDASAGGQMSLFDRSAA